MVSNRERAGAAMAALDRRNSNLDDFVGLNWSSWIDRANVSLSEGTNVEEYSNGIQCTETTETMALRTEDMHIYGHYPAHDDFYLVVCVHCGQVVKPQAFEQHCERRHGSLAKTCSQAANLAPQPRPGRPPSVPTTSRERQKESRYHPGESSAESAGPQHKPSKTHKEMVSLRNATSQETPASPSHPPTALSRIPARAFSSSSYSSPLSSDRKPPQTSRAGQAVGTARPPRGPTAHSRPYKSDFKKECDLNRHCGVLDPVKKKPCTRQLVCNIHSIHQRRKVVGRSKAFDMLVAEQRAGSAGRDPGVDPATREAHTQKDTQPYSGAAEETPEAQQIQQNLRDDRPLPSSMGKADSVLEGAVGVEAQHPHPFNQNPPSSEESEGEEREEAGDFPATPWHPKPHGICTFGSHTLGCSIFTFGRRLHHLRFALNAMVEHHISAHLWRKIPQVATSLRSHNKACARATAGRPTGCSSSPHSGQQQPRGGRQQPPRDRQHCGSLGLGRPRNPVGRPSKARLRELELTGRSQEDARLLCGAKVSSAKCIRDLPLHEKGQPHSPAKVCPAPSTKGPMNVNGGVSLGKKPCLPRPLQPPLSGRVSPYHAPQPRSRGRSPGARPGALGYEHRAPPQKRKAGGDGSPPLSPALARAPKSNRLAPQQPRSSLFSWKGENMGSVLTCGPEKRIDA